MSMSGGFLKIKARLFIKSKDIFLHTIGKAKPGSLLQSTIRIFAQTFVGPVPYVIKLDINTECNINCKMCYSSKEDIEVPFEKIKKLLDQVKGMRMRLDIMGGEPLLHKNIVSIVAYAKKTAGFKEVIIYTNGTVADKMLAEELKMAGVDKIMVNLSSSDKKTHDAFTRNPGFFDKTLAGIKNFKAAEIETFAFVVLHNKNIGEYEKIRDFAVEKLKIKPVFFQYIPQMINDKLSVDKEKWALVKHKVLYEDSPSHGKYIEKVITFCGTECLGGYYSVSVKVNGDMTPCPFINDIVMGNVYKENFWDVFAKRNKSKSFTEFTKLPDACIPCSYKKLCGGGCKAGNKALFGSYRQKDCRCLGQYNDKVSKETMHDRMPTYF